MNIKPTEISAVISEALREFPEANLQHLNNVFGSQRVVATVKNWSYYNYINNNKIKLDSRSDDTIFKIEFPWDYFQQDSLEPLDTAAMVKPLDRDEEKAKKRCLVLIKDTYDKWIESHPYSVESEKVRYSGEEMHSYIQHALDAINKSKDWKLYLVDYYMRGADMQVRISDERLIHVENQPILDLTVWVSWFQDSGPAANLLDKKVLDSGKDIKDLPLEQKIYFRLITFIYYRLKDTLKRFGY